LIASPTGWSLAISSERMLSTVIASKCQHTKSPISSLRARPSQRRTGPFVLRSDPLDDASAELPAAVDSCGESAFMVLIRQAWGAAF